MRGTAALVLGALVLLLASPGDARPRKAPPSGDAWAASEIAAPLRTDIESATATATGRDALVLDRLWPVAAPRKGEAGLALATLRGPEGPGGVVALLRLPSGKLALEVLAQRFIPRLGGYRFERRPLLDLDGDGRPDLVLPWEETHRDLRRGGAFVARTSPPSLSTIDLRSEYRGKATALTVACFAPVVDQKARLLVIHRLVDGQDELELLEPDPAGAWRAGQLSAAVLGQELEVAASIQRYWRRLGHRRDKARASWPEQAELTACPAAGVILPSRLLSPAAPGFAVLGPFAHGADRVRDEVKRLRAARATLIIGLGAPQEL